MEFWNNYGWAAWCIKVSLHTGDNKDHDETFGHLKKYWNGGLICSNKLGSLRKHDNDGNKNVKTLHIWQCQTIA